MIIQLADWGWFHSILSAVSRRWTEANKGPDRAYIRKIRDSVVKAEMKTDGTVQGSFVLFF